MTRPSKAERAYQATVIDALRLRGCIVKHDYPLMTRGGEWRTGSTLPGWPDLFAFHPKRWNLLIEIKVPPNRLEPEQRAVLSRAAEIPCNRAWCIRPDDPDWATLMEWVRSPKDAPAVYGFEPHPDPVRLLAEAELRREQRRVDRAASGLRSRSRRPRPAGTLPGL